jgi:hypothetical protein
MKRSLKPGVENLETREVPTVVGGHVLPPSSMDLAMRAARLSPAVATTVTPPVPPIIQSLGAPYPIEVRRTRFHAFFVGRFYDGPPHYTSQRGTISMSGTGSSTQFLHGSVQLTTILPVDNTAAITGAAYLQDKNLSGGNAFALDYVIDGSTLDSHGRPTQGTFVADPNIYGGSSFFFQGGGTIRFRYRKNTASVTFDGSLYTNGISNVLAPSSLFAQHGHKL